MAQKKASLFLYPSPVAPVFLPAADSGGRRGGGDGAISRRDLRRETKRALSVSYESAGINRTVEEEGQVGRGKLSSGLI